MSGGVVNIGLMGLGTVGGGVAAALLDNAASIQRKTGAAVCLRRALVRDAARPRQPELPAGVITANPEDILADPEIGVVVEVMGGDRPAGDYLARALDAGKHVVTANKEVMARRGLNCWRWRKSGVSICCLRRRPAAAFRLWAV